MARYLGELNGRLSKSGYQRELLIMTNNGESLPPNRRRAFPSPPCSPVRRAA